VLHDFDGHTWRRDYVGLATTHELQPVGREYRYTLSLEPNQHRWLFALDWPDHWDSAGATLSSDYMLVASAPVSKLTEIVAVSHTRVEAADTLNPAMRKRDLRVPPQRNPRTLQFARDLRGAHPEDMDYVRAVLDMFHGQQFYYTLEPPPLSENSVDDFLFDTKRGFCGHYASAFAMLMRAAGIPARVVTGYQGGSFNRFADYWIVRQSDAHAWDEIWIDGRGWLRIDPTAAVSPARVERGARAALAADDPLADGWRRHFAWVSDVRLQLDAIRQLWRERILRFDQLSQDRILSRLGIAEPDGQKIVVLMAIGLALGFAWLTWQVRREQRPENKDPLVRAYERLCRKLASAGLPRHPHEGAEAFSARIALVRPDLAQAVSALCRRYSRLRYGASRPIGAERSFILRVRAFRPRAAGR
jgi:transglutaminase-like putative cysteine protease